MLNTTAIPIHEPRVSQSAPVTGFTRSEEKYAWRCFLAIAFSMFLNFFLAILNAHGVGMDNLKVTIIQITVTLACGSLIFSSKTPVRLFPALAIASLIALLLVMNLTKTPNIRSFYDCLIIPMYIALGGSAPFVRDRWMSVLFWLVVAVVGLEVVLPSVYATAVNPAAFFSATRSWVAAQGEIGGAQDGLYVGAYRGGGLVFSLSDHRVSGPFLEPLSLGYFAVLMAIYFTGFRTDRLIYRLSTTLCCIVLSLLSDSRAASALIVLCAGLLLVKPRLPSLVIWCTAPAVFAFGWIVYVWSPDFLVGDMLSRISFTFEPLLNMDISRLFIGDVPLGHVNDSGMIYLMYYFGPLGFLLATWYYCGAFTRSTRSSPALFTAIAFYASATLLFGGALFSIKTASLMGFLVGLGGRSTSPVSSDNILE